MAPVTDDLDQDLKDSIAENVRPTRRKTKRRNRTEASFIKRAEARIARTINPQRKPKQMGRRRLRWDTGYHRSHPVRTLAAVARRAAVDPVGEVWRQVAPMRDLVGAHRTLMCADCKAETDCDRCTQCGGSNLVDHLTCSACGAECDPSEMLVGEVHCGHGPRAGKWEVPDA